MRELVEQAMEYVEQFPQLIRVYRSWDKHAREVMETEVKLGNNFIHIGYEHFISEKDWDKLESEDNLEDFLNNYPYEHNPAWAVANPVLHPVHNQ